PARRGGGPGRPQGSRACPSAWVSLNVVLLGSRMGTSPRLSAPRKGGGNLRCLLPRRGVAVLDHGEGNEDGQDRSYPDDRLNEGPPSVGGRERGVHVEETAQRVRQHRHRVVLGEGL